MVTWLPVHMSHPCSLITKLPQLPGLIPEHFSQLPGYLVTWLPEHMSQLPGYLVTWLPGYLREAVKEKKMLTYGNLP